MSDRTILKSQIKSGRGRPEMLLEDRERVKLRISKIAEKLFKEKGYGNVSIRRIAKEMGVTPMALYRYYDGKIDILRSLWGGVINTLFDQLDALPNHNLPYQNLSNLAVHYVDFWCSNPDQYRLVFMAEGVTQPDVDLFLDHPEIINRYDLFMQAIMNITSSDDDAAEIKVKLDFFISVLHGIIHNHITISGYAWSSPQAQLKYAIKALTA